ncbi:mannose-P-dolichol utilization defect 1 protein-like isoform X2 [Ornithodoros turicata]|uniref:mannose-P-dolichol utilization defect 1 protein-like isoform X2 n=1 Tax=Ornithodoros turicata TaxID=34597 RepID=UPI003138A124
MMSEAGCLKIALSKTLGYGIIVGSTLVKVPQIVKLWKAQSAEGISLASVLLELGGITATTAYSFANRYPFSAWGEGLFLAFETALIAMLVLQFRGQQGRAWAFFAAYIGLTSILSSGVAPMPLLAAAQVASVPIVIFGKLMQAWRNYRQGHTGQLSAITAGLLFGGALARIFTSLTETGDPLMVATFALAAGANCTLFTQVLYYWEATNKRLLQQRKKD